MKDSSTDKKIHFRSRLRKAIDRFLGGTHHHHACFLPEKTGWLSGLALRLLFSRIRMDEKQYGKLKNLPAGSMVVYATKYKSKFEFLFAHTRYSAKKLPFPEFGFDYRFLWMQPLSRLIKILISGIDYFFRHFSRPDPYRSRYLQQQLAAGRCGLLSLVEKKGFYRRFVKKQNDPIRCLVEMQREIHEPIFIVPQLLMFSKKPLKSNLSLVDVLLGTEHKPGILRGLFMLFRNPDHVFVELSMPLSLRAFLHQPENRDRSAEYLSLAIRRDLLLQINRHRQSIIGPIIKSRLELKESILTHRRLQEFIDDYAEAHDMPVWKVRKKADAYLEEIAAKYSIKLINLFAMVLRWITNNIFEGFVIDYEGLNRMKEMSRKGPLILMPCHKSHIDYLMLSYVMYHNNMPCPHIAAGKNLSFWPLGPVFRNSGAFFLRRSFKGKKLYAKVFADYIFKLLEEGFNIEFFIEGTRSRTGKLFLPKLGLLNMLLDAWENGACDDLILTPIFIGYDRVLEEKAYLHELEGGEKQTENLGQIIKARKFLKKRYGKIYMQFHEPISLADLLRQEEIDLRDLDADEKAAFGRNLAFRTIHAINRISIVTPFSIVAAALLNCSKTRFTFEHIFSHVDTFVHHLVSQNAHLADTLATDHHAAALQAFEVFQQRKLLEPAPREEAVEHAPAEFRLVDHRRPSLEYYKNNCVSFFVPAAFTALEILERDAFQFSSTDLHRGYRFLQRLFKNEFAYDVEKTPEFYVRKSIKSFIDHAVLIPHQTLPDTYNVTSAGFRTLKLFANFLTSYFESYRIVLRFLMMNTKPDIGEKDAVRLIEKLGNRLYKKEEIQCREALSRVTYSYGLKFFNSRGIFSAADEAQIQENTKAIQRYLELLQS